MGKYIVIVIAIIVVILALVLMNGNPSAPSGEQAGTGGEPSVPAPTGNVDDAVAAIMRDMEGDTLPAAEADSSLAEGDSGAAGDVSKAFDASGF